MSLGRLHYTNYQYIINTCAYVESPHCCLFSNCSKSSTTRYRSLSITFSCVVKIPRSSHVLREFFQNFCICNIHGIPNMFMWIKNIPHRDCSETWAISKYVSNITFLYKTLLFVLNFDLKNELVKFWNIAENQFPWFTDRQTGIVLS